MDDKLDSVIKEIHSNNTDAVSSFIKSHEDWGDALPLVEASISRSKDVIRLLVESGVDINQRRHYDALILACKDSDIELVKYLISKGANVNTRQDSSSLISHMCSNHNGEPISDERYEIVKLLLENGATPNRGKSDHSSCLASAVASNDHRTIDLLLKYKAKINFPDCYAAAMKSLSEGRKDTFVKLVEKGLKINPKVTTNKYEERRPASPLSLAIYGKDIELVEYLIDKGINVNYIPNAPTATNSTYSLTCHHAHPIVYAVEVGSNEIMNILLENGSSPDGDPSHSWGDLGIQPLILAIYKGNKEAVKSLIKHGANLDIFSTNTRFKDGIISYKTPLRISEMVGHYEIEKMLKEAGAKLSLIEKPFKKDYIETIANELNKYDQITRILTIEIKDKGTHEELYIGVQMKRGVDSKDARKYLQAPKEILRKKLASIDLYLYESTE
ncbi:hypothetical protein R50073_45860 [Maricurvus nonylphenolicus]|uniref:ankyrin repeat domain-containing protein n=1 Tax=Maricurvus nonylphenolicus TaxID=1008307 RepID=UPI0036F2F5ED